MNKTEGVTEKRGMVQKCNVNLADFSDTVPKCRYFKKSADVVDFTCGPTLADSGCAGQAVGDTKTKAERD